MIQRHLSRSLQSLVRQQGQVLLGPGRAPFATFRPIAIQTTRLQSRRWYSEKQDLAEKKEDGQTDDTEKAAKPADEGKEDPLRTELDAKKKELVEMTDRAKRSVAEYRNLQEQTKREVQAARDFAIQRFARDLIESIDNLDRALTTVPADKLAQPENKDLIDLHSGLKMTEKILMDTVKRHGLERVDPSLAGEKFDPNIHEATFQAPQQGKEDGTVFYTQQKGFSLNGRVLRAPKVGVVKNS